MWRLLLIALSVSVDGFFAGFGIGLRNIKFPVYAMAIAGCSSGLVIGLAMPIGHWLARHLSTAWSTDFAAVLFISIGVMAILNRNPERIDIDQSGAIGLREACFLGLLLSMDSLIAGITAGMLGFTIASTAVTIAVCCAVLIGSGFFMSQLIRARLNFSVLTWVPGLIFIGLGLSKFIQ